MAIRNLKTLTAVVLIAVLSACSRQGAGPTPFTPLQSTGLNHLLVATASFQDQKGELVSVGLTQSAGAGQILKGELTLSSDPWFRQFPGNPLVYVINRTDGNIQTFRKDTLKKVSPQVSLNSASEFGLGPNPQDVLADAKGNVFVSGLNLTQLISLPSDLSSVKAWFDASLYADPIDGLPECAHMEWVDGKMWVAMQRLNRGADRRALDWLPTDHSSVVVIDPATHSKTEIILQGETPDTKGINPFSPFRVTADWVYVANRGGNAPNTGGGIERIARKTFDSQTVVTEAQLGGKPLDLIVSGSTAWVILGKPDFGTKLVEVDLTTKAVSAPIIDTDYLNYLSGLAYDPTRHLLFFGYRQVTHPGIQVWNVDKNEYEMPEPIDVGFPPVVFELTE